MGGSASLPHRLSLFKDWFSGLTCTNLLNTCAVAPFLVTEKHVGGEDSRVGRRDPGPTAAVKGLGFALRLRVWKKPILVALFSLVQMTPAPTLHLAAEKEAEKSCEKHEA